MLDFVQKIVAKMTKRRIRRKKGSRRLSRLKTAAAWPENHRRRRSAAACSTDGSSPEISIDTFNFPTGAAETVHIWPSGREY